MRRPRAVHSAERPEDRPFARSRRHRSRILITTFVFAAIYLMIGARLVEFGRVPVARGEAAAGQISTSRPDILDRNGSVLATDVKTFSLYAEPRKIVDVNPYLRWSRSLDEPQLRHNSVDHLPFEREQYFSGIGPSPQTQR